MKAVAIVSGGLDSTTMVFDLLAKGVEITSMVSFNYGQRHKKELSYASGIADKLHVNWHLINLHTAGVTKAIASSGSSLVSDTPVPEGHYAADNMKATVVPNRNMMMISIAGAIAVAENAEFVAVGVHSGDHFIYPDCRPDFIEYVGRAMYEGNKGFGSFGSFPVYAPFLYLTKEQIAYKALEYGVPLHETWSCYKGGKKHCGKCGTCVERLEAIDGALQKYVGVYGHNAHDTTAYEDKDYWREAVNAH